MPLQAVGLKSEEIKYVRTTRKDENVAVVGLGYIGVPLACLLSEKDHKVLGYDIDKRKISKFKNKGINIDSGSTSIAFDKKRMNFTYRGKDLKNADVIIICVPTPVRKDHQPDLMPLKSASKEISKFLTKGQLIIIESTVNPGVSEEIVKPILETSGFKAGIDFDLAHCPERINPGDKKWNIRNVPRVLGGITEKSAQRAKKFYQRIIDAPITVTNSLKEAEAVKIVENAFRDINIAFVNELAICFDKLGVDILNVIRGASTKPFAFLAHYPSCGVGGHCIPVDPYYLIKHAEQNGFDHKFLKLAREINNSMPGYTVKKLEEALKEANLSMDEAKIGLFGLSYKKDISDLRESPSFGILEILRRLKRNHLYIYDPYHLDISNVKSLNKFLKEIDVLIVATDHSSFLQIKPIDFLKNNIRVIVDGKNCLDKEVISNLGIIYKGIGR